MWGCNGEQQLSSQEVTNFLKEQQTERAVLANVGSLDPLPESITGLVDKCELAEICLNAEQHKVVYKLGTKSAKQW